MLSKIKRKSLLVTKIKHKIYKINSLTKKRVKTPVNILKYPLNLAINKISRMNKLLIMTDKQNNSPSKKNTTLQKVGVILLIGSIVLFYILSFKYLSQ